MKSDSACLTDLTSESGDRVSLYKMVGILGGLFEAW